MQLLERLRADFNAHQETVRALTDTIAENEGVPTDEQSALLAAENGEIEALLPRIQEATQLASRMHGAAELLSGVPGDLDASLRRTMRAPRGAQFSSWGEFAAARATSQIDAETIAEIDRAFVTMESQRAFADVTTSDVPGLLPPAWLTDILDFVGAARPTLEAFDVRPLPPSGMTVQYPAITQRPLVGAQVGEKTDIPSRDTKVAAHVANVVTYGGGEDVSVQVLQRTEPAYLTLMLQLYAEQMAMQMNAAAIAAITGSGIGDVTGDVADINAAFAEASAMVFAANAVPNTVVLGLGVWQAMASAKDSTGRPLFPNVAPMNPVGNTSLSSTGGDVHGLNFIVDPGLPTSMALVGWNRAFVSMVSGVQTLSADNPSKLGRDYAVFEFAAFAPRRPDAIVAVHFTLSSTLQAEGRADYSTEPTKPPTTESTTPNTPSSGSSKSS